MPCLKNVMGSWGPKSLALMLLLLAITWSPSAQAQFQRGDIYIGAFDPQVIYKVEPVSYSVTIFADGTDGLSGPSAVAFTPDGTKLLSSNYTSAQVLQFDAAGNGSVLLDSSDGLSGPFGENGLAFDDAGNLYVSDYRSSRILRFPGGIPPGVVFADSTDGIARPDGLAFAANGDLFVANRNAGNILQIDPSGNASVFDTIPGNPFSIAIRGNGDIYVAVLSTGEVFRYVGGVASNRVLLTTVSSEDNPAIAFDLTGSVLYYTSHGVGNLITIDPDTGSHTQVIAPGGVDGGLAITVFGILAVDIDIRPEFDFNALGTQHTLTGTLMRGLDPVPDVEVTFEVFAGPNGGDGGTDTTNADGEATFTYTGDGGEGVDQIEAFFVEEGGETITSNEALKFWDEDCQDPPNGIPDTCDIDCDGFDGFCSEFAGCGGSADDDGNGVPDECIIPPVVSYAVEGGLPHSETFDGTPVRPADAVNVSNGALVFSAFPDAILEDIDALHVMSDGSVVFSTSTDVTQGFGGLPNIKNGDLVLWDGATATLLFSELIGFGSTLNNIDAFSILPNGNWLLSTDLPAFLGGLVFQNGDIVEYDPVADVANLYMGLDEATIFTGTPQSNADIDALHVRDNGNVIFSIRSNGIGRIGNDLPYGWPDAASTDLFELDPDSGHAEVFLDGFGLFDGVTRNLDAVSLAPRATIALPEPGGLLLLGFEIAGLLVIGWRRMRG